MPHVVFDNEINLERLSKEFCSIFAKEKIIIKIEDIFLNREKNIALIPTLVIDEKHQQFMMVLNTREKKSTLRLDPNTDPEKTDGVKQAMGMVTLLILSIFTDLQITKTNIREFIPKGLLENKNENLGSRTT